MQPYEGPRARATAATAASAAEAFSAAASAASSSAAAWFQLCLARAVWSVPFAASDCAFENCAFEKSENVSFVLRILYVTLPRT